MNGTYSIRITRYWDYFYDPPECVAIYDVWRGEEWLSGHRTKAEAEAKVRLLREHGRSTCSS